MNVTHMVLDEASFRTYSKSEILQLSVKEIVNPLTFDLLQNPVPGGLHDPCLGPCRRDDRCETCGQSELKCPGHMGHISLPVLVFNPLFFKTLLQVLQGTCLSCHRVMLMPKEMKRYTCQLTLLQKGMIVQAGDLEETCRKVEWGEFTPEELESALKDIMGDAEKCVEVISKNTLTERKSVTNHVLSLLKHASRKCCHCQVVNRELTGEYMRTIVGKLLTKKKEPKKKRIGKNKENEPEHMAEEEEVADEIDMETRERNAEEPQDIGSKQKSKEPELLMAMEHFLTSNHHRCILSPNIAQDHLRLVWKNDKDFLSKLLPFLNTVKESKHPTDILFLDVLPVPASKFRPLSVMKEKKYEHPQTVNLSYVLQESEVLRELMGKYSKRIEGMMGGNVQGLTMPDTDESMAALLQKVMGSWMRLQTKINVVLDSNMDKLSQEKCFGVKQLLEKKEGLFRMHMMGKRVNFCARSVISPDPYIATNEIGIPVVFASKLTYPERVTPWNVQKLRHMVINGPANYPGASSVINEDGSVVRLNPSNQNSREAIANQLLVPDKDSKDGKIVCRNLIDGDFLLLNRQPTLHRPSIQAHKARVLPDIKTLRMHYSNCKAYNADFDGDEMNCHFPQDELSRAEASTLACTDYQYLVPKDGTPLAGLIQDHMVAGVALTIRGRFFNKQDYWSLLWSAMNDMTGKIQTLTPAIIKPQPLWSGKQIISTILLNIIPKGKDPLSLKSRAKIPEKSWISWTQSSNPDLGPLSEATLETVALGESTVVVSQGELLQGVLDKAHYGPSPYGLVHCCYELYGGKVAGKLLTYLGRLFTSFLQKTGFSLGVGDILVKPKADKKRKHLMKKSQNVGKTALKKAVAPEEEEIEESQLLLGLKEAHFDKDSLKMAEIDMCMKAETDRIQDGIAKSIIPAGLEKDFPANSLQLMVQSGAKGSPVNCMQISCLLGQIELEGRRPPLMLSGRSLPSFVPYDVNPRAGGFVTGRFLTGIRPQEYFFHCMAGREGLIDTAVKTSRSGYLQRCLVKHLEGIMVNYDLTVRESDGSLIQFYYGEDGLEPQRCPYLKPSQFPFLAENMPVIHNPSEKSPWLGDSDKTAIRRSWKKISKWREHAKENWITRQSGFLEFSKTIPATEEDVNTLDWSKEYPGRSVHARKVCESWRNLSHEKMESFDQLKVCPDPVMSRYLPHSQPDVQSEKFRHLLNVYLKKGFSKVADQAAHRVKLDPNTFKDVMNKKVVQALANPGEAVGLICAQSIGEPSTQMTLNTFHFAGRGEMNVTLGIPRLREILMTGGDNIRTPSLDVPVLPVEGSRQKAEKLQRHLNQITLDKVMKSVKIKVRFVAASGPNQYNHKLVETKFSLLDRREYSNVTNLRPKTVIQYIAKHFLKKVGSTIRMEAQLLEETTLLNHGKVRVLGDGENAQSMTGADGGEDAEVDPNDGDAATVKEQQRQSDSQEYEGEEDEMKAVVTEVDEDMDESGSDDEANEDADVSEESSVSSKETKDLILLAKFHSFVKDFKFDEKKHRWCKVIFSFDQSELQLDVRLLLEKLVRSSVVHRVKGISRAFLVEENEDAVSVLHLKTEGVNVQELFKYQDLLDLNRLYSNCVATMAAMYGIEAANRVLIKEIQTVFGAYGITVDYRHLSLLADYMTCRGKYDPFSRHAITFNTSPLQKMSFETAMNFLMDTTLSGEEDKLQSPSATLVVGKGMHLGTGSFDLLQES